MAEKEFIEREAALKLLGRNSITKYITFADDVSIYDTIKNIPAADVVEVVHGEWISEIGSYCTSRCSACGWDKPYTEDYYCAKELYSTWNYCPNCGAEMDGKGADNAEQN